MPEQGLGEFLLDVCSKHGSRVAVRSRIAERTYEELLTRARRLAGGLRSLSLAPGDRVALMMENQVEALEAYLGCFFADVVAVHVNDRLVAREVEYILADSGAEAVIHTAGVTGVIRELDAADLPLRHIISIGHQGDSDSISYEQLVDDAESLTEPPARRGQDTAVIAYTSGTTGRPKGVILSNEGIIACTKLVPVTYQLPQHGTCAYMGTFSFISGLWGIHLPHLYLGARIDLLQPATADEWIDHVAREGSTFTNLPSPLADAVIAKLRALPGAFSTVRRVIHAGSPLRPAQTAALVDLLGDRFTEVWGMTEACGPVTASVDGDWRAIRDDDFGKYVGRAVLGAKVRVVDASGEAREAGEGELQVRTGTLFDGYVANPGATSAAFVEGWYCTGDLGWIDDSGRVYITGRASDLVISGGMNVYPAEVESVLVKHPKVKDVVVVGMPHEKWGEAVTAVVVPASEIAPDESELIAFARQYLASYKKPQRIHIWGEVPRNASQKVDRSKVRELLVALNLSDEEGTSK